MKGKSVLLRLTAADFMFYMSAAAGICYLSVFLYDLGYSEAQVGVITAVNSALAIVSGPLWGMLADRLNRTVGVLLFCGLTGGVLYALVPGAAGLKAAGVPLVLVLVPVAMFFRTPTNSLADNIFLRESEKHGLNYGLMRGAGSLAFAITALVLGFIVPKTGSAITFYLAFVLVLPAFGLILSVSRGESGTKEKAEKLHFGELFGNRQLVSYLLLSAVFTMMLYCNGTFLPKLLETIDVSSGRVGLVTGAKAFIEVPFIALLPWLRKHFKFEWVLAAAGLMFAAQALIFSFATQFWQIMAASLLLDGIGSGLFYACAAVYVFSLAPERLKTTAVTCVGAMSSLSGVLGNLLGGFVSNRFGVQSYYLALAVLGAAASVAFILTRKPTKIR